MSGDRWSNHRSITRSGSWCVNRLSPGWQRSEQWEKRPGRSRWKSWRDNRRRSGDFYCERLIQEMMSQYVCRLWLLFLEVHVNALAVLLILWVTGSLMNKLRLHFIVKAAGISWLGHVTACQRSGRVILVRLMSGWESAAEVSLNTAGFKLGIGRQINQNSTRFDLIKNELISLAERWTLTEDLINTDFWLVRYSFYCEVLTGSGMFVTSVKKHIDF